LLREGVRRGTELGQRAKSYMDAGELVPDDLVIGMLKARIARDDGAGGFILDGFPRTIPQAEALDHSEVSIDKVVNFQLDDDVIVRRLSGRRIHRGTGKIYNVNPGGIPAPPSDMPESALLQRDDDQPGAIRNRLDVYRRQTEPLIAYYEARRLLVNVNGAQDLDPICAEVRRVTGL